MADINADTETTDRYSKIFRGTSNVGCAELALNLVEGIECEGVQRWAVAISLRDRLTPSADSDDADPVALALAELLCNMLEQNGTETMLKECIKTIQ